MEFLPPAQSVAGEIRNPVVTRALSELRRLINTLIRAYGKPTAIRIELARDLKRGKDDRAKDIKKNKDNERTRLDAAERIVREAGISGPSASDILRVRLWEECGKACPYTGRSIGFAQLFGEDVDVEHIVPFSKSLDDSFINKTICFAEVNRREKGNRTPSEAFGAQPDRWAEMVQRMKHNVEAYGMPRAKLERFLLAGEALEERMAEFKSSQLNDTRYASRSARQYLAHLYGGVVSQGVDSQGRLRVQVGNGQVTALLRRVLGMNQLLETPLGDKRSDHRHHAVDAVAVALTSPSMQHSLAKGCEDAWSNRRRRLGNIEVPWTGFDRDVRAAVDRIVVSHRIDNRVRGALHAETLYSPPRDKDGRRAVDAGFSHVRKPLERLSPSEVEDIVDERVKRHVIDHLAGRLPSKVYASEVPESFPTLPNRHGAPIPIKRVRIRKKNSTREIGSGNRLRFVENSENHHLEIVEAADSKGRPKWVGTVVTVAMASARRSSPNFPIVERRPGFQLSLCKNDVVELDTQPGHRALFLVRGISQFSAGQVVLDFSQICDARQVGKIPRQGRTATPDVLRQRNCRKVTVLPIGVLRPCRA